MVLRESDGKYSLFDEIWQTRHFWEQTGPANEKGSEIIRTCRLHQSPPIPGTVALVDITEQTRVYHYNLGTPCLVLMFTTASADNTAHGIGNKSLDL